MFKEGGVNELVLSETEKSYIAGIIDGEGSISLYPKKVKGKVRIGMCVGVTSTFLELLEWLKERADFGKISKKARRKRNWKDRFYIDMKSPTKIYNFLSTIYPYLIVKKGQADLVLTFIRCRSGHLKLRDGFYDPELDILENFINKYSRLERARIRKLNLIKELRKQQESIPYKRIPVDWLEKKYLEEEKSMYEIAGELECSPEKVYKYLKEYGLVEIKKSQ